MRDLPATVRRQAPGRAGPLRAQPDLTVEEAEKQLIIRALKECDGNRTQAATKIGHEPADASPETA